MNRRKLLKVLGSAVGATAVWPVGAQGDKGIVHILVPYAAGGQTDILARLMAASMQKTMSRTVLVENKPGAAALIATNAVRIAPPDGDTVLFHNSGMVIHRCCRRRQTATPRRISIPWR
jgi:tripartite-type tricarboxylate transporter receptor subunit TctC